MNYIFPSPSHFTIYTKSGCKYCSLVKDLLNQFVEHPDRIDVVDCDSYLEKNKEEFLEFIFQLTQIRYRMFPMVFYQGTFIGGYNETFKWVQQQTAFMECDDF